MNTWAMTILSAALAAVLLSACGGPGAIPVNELKTPRYKIPEAPEVDFDAVAPEEIHTAGEGVIKIDPKAANTEPYGSVSEDMNPSVGDTVAPNPLLIGETPETIWENDQTVTYNAYTLPERAAMNNEGVVGILTIPSINLSMNVYEAENEMEAMLHGGAHYKDTSCYDGNVGISAHVSGVPDAVSFSNLHLLQTGDTLSYQTAIGTRSYTVTENREIADDDWSWLARTTDNRITLTTCIAGKPDKRLLVQAVAE